MFCPKCGSETNDDDCFCSICGSVLPKFEIENSSTNEKTSKFLDVTVISGLVIIAIGLIIAIIIVVQKNDTQTINTKTVNTNTASIKKTSETTPTSKTYKVKETMPYGNFLVTAKRFYTSSTFYPNGDNILTITPDSNDDKFIICSLVVKNDSSTPATFCNLIAQEDIHLIDSHNSVYYQNDLTGYSEGLSNREINPGSEVTGSLVFSINKKILNTKGNKFYLIMGTDKFLVSL